MDVANMQLTLRTRFRDPDQRVVGNSTWLDYLNAAYRDVIGASPFWPFMENQATELTVSAAATGVDLPTDAWRVDAVYNVTDDIELTPIDGNSGQFWGFAGPGVAGQTGNPSHYRLRNNRILVYPNPAAETDLQVEYRVTPTMLLAGEPAFAEQYHGILIEGALARAYRDDGNTPQADYHDGKFNALLERMKDDLLSTRGQHYPQIIDAW
jgi:hypothetical protein